MGSPPVTDQEFLRRLRRYARRVDSEIHYRPHRGKGSHAEVWLEDRKATLPKGELKPGTLLGILRQLGIDKREF